ncbi:MAG: hypothetical protein KY455_08565 [Euryarchaeota archaeon]|nr:hypothetical protein [Euryarchaeota archaeon]
MSTTIRVRPEDKERLERIQEAWRRLKGEKVSHLDLVGHILAYIERQGDEAIHDIAWRPWSESECRAFLGRFVRHDLPPTDMTNEIDEYAWDDPNGERRS